MPQISELEFKHRLAKVDAMIQNGENVMNAFEAAGFLKTEEEIQKEEKETAAIFERILKNNEKENFYEHSIA